MLFQHFNINQNITPFWALSSFRICILYSKLFVKRTAAPLLAQSGCPTVILPVFQCVSCSKKIFALSLRRKSKTSFLFLNSPKPFVLNVTIFSSSHSPMTKFTVDNNTWVTVEGGCGEGNSPWPTVAENGPKTQCDSDLSNWEKYKPQQVVRVPNAVSVVYSVNWQVQRQAIVKTHRVGPRGPTTRERERRGRESEKRPTRAVQTHSIHTKRQTKTNVTCKQLKVKSKETVGKSCTVLKVILGHKYHHNH